MRCFLAAWPDAATRLALSAVLDDVGQRVEHRRATRVDDLHLTLAFMGELADNVTPAVAQAAEALDFRPFEWRMDLLGMFKPAGVVWMGADAESETSLRLSDLATGLRQQLDRLSVSYDDRPLVPHVTLLHGAKQFTNERIAPVTWHIDSVALYRSTGSRSAARYERVLG